MYRRPKFLEKLLDVRREMAAEADYDVILFAQIARADANLTIARNQPVTRVVTGEETKARRTSLTKNKKQTSVEK